MAFVDRPLAGDWLDEGSAGRRDPQVSDLAGWGAVLDLRFVFWQGLEFGR